MQEETIDAKWAKALAEVICNGPGLRISEGFTREFNVILVGDMCYERPLAERLMDWLKSMPAEILLGDPGRSYFPKDGLTRLAHYSVATTRELSPRE